MYKEHPSFDPPADAAVLWRYLDFTKFVSLLDKRALFLARADKLMDPFEGSFPRGDVARHIESFQETIKLLQENLPYSLEESGHPVLDFVRESRKFTLISCWHESSHESAAMWRLYTGEQDGIAIKSDFQSLAKSFTCENDIFVGKVKYIDYDSASISDSNALAPFLYKRDSFEHEKEVRAINWDLPIPSPITLENCTPDFSTPLHEVGAYRQVDVSRLVQEVIVAPYAADWFKELIQSAAVLYGLKVPVRRSFLADEPAWE